MRKATVIVLLGFLSASVSFGQKAAKPVFCGHYPKDLEELKYNYEHFQKYLGVKSGERVASVGASSGSVEMQIACYVSDVDWTIQDIDTLCLNQREVKKVINHFEGLTGRKIDEQFTIIVGGFDKTNLPRDTYDRVLLVNVVHELSEQQKILTDIHGALKNNGLVVVMERMATKKGQKHGDCRLPKLWEPDFIQDMKGYGFEMADKTKPVKKFPLIYYTFRRVH